MFFRLKYTLLKYKWRSKGLQRRG